jgi:hypothetical protein
MVAPGYLRHAGWTSLRDSLTILDSMKLFAHSRRSPSHVALRDPCKPSIPKTASRAVRRHSTLATSASRDQHHMLE